MTSPLDGIKILELVRVAPGAFTTMMLADMGADVLKIETPPDTSTNLSSTDATEAAKRAPLSYVNRNKRSIALNLKHSEAQPILHRLVADADVLVEGFRPGVMARLQADYPTLSEINPRLIYCSLSGFGQDGPYAQYPAHDINFLSISGVLNFIGQPDQPPAIPLNIVADYAGASMHGVMGILVALLARQHTGRGQLVDISYLDTTISLLAATPALRDFFSQGTTFSRGEGALGGSYPYYTTYQTSDQKYLSVGCTEPYLWENFCRAIGREDLKSHTFKPEHFTSPADTAAQTAKADIQTIIGQKTRDEWFNYFKDKNVCVGPVYNADETFADPHVKAREMVIDVADAHHGPIRQTGIAIKLSDTPGSIRRVGPSVGEHTDDVLSALGYDTTARARLKQDGAVA